MTAPSGVVFNIQRFSLHDGPGIRTTVFLKGCTLSCFWCHNPEGQQAAPELRYYSDRCIACGHCVDACPHHAHELSGGVHTFVRERCDFAAQCVASCHSRALETEGRSMSVAEVMDEILPDRPFYELSGGGVTLSGGEPVLGRDFARALLQQCREHGLHTAVETCGEVPWTALEALLPHTDLIMMDLKVIDAAKHRAATRQTNERILANARRLAATRIPIVFRTPVVPTVNDTPDDIGAIAAFVRQLRDLRQAQAGADAAITYEIMPFHRLAAGKYASLGLAYPAATLEPLSPATMAALAEVARQQGIATLNRGDGRHP
jgi:pyruvate formate lyase activating enzyme